jgi:hypothetical protein
VSAGWSPLRDTGVLEMDDLEESERADIGGECGGKGTEAGSTLGTRGDLLVEWGSLERVGDV